MSYRNLNTNVNKLASAVQRDITQLATEHAKVVGVVNFLQQLGEARYVLVARVVIVQGIVDAALIAGLAYALLSR